MDNAILEAAAFAARAHQGSLRKDKITPYVSHVFRVCLIVRHVFGFDDPAMLTAALLHDTIEDTTTDFDDLAEHFGPQVAEWVAALTKDKCLPEDAREIAYIEKLLAAPWQVRACKLADLYDNLTDLTNLPKERWAKSLGRYEQYFTALRDAVTPELERPVALVGQLLAERKRANP